MQTRFDAIFWKNHLVINEFRVTYDESLVRFDDFKNQCEIKSLEESRTTIFTFRLLFVVFY